MTVPNSDGAEKMAKRQKNAFLDEALCEAIDAHLLETGGTFSRFIAAAALQYLHSPAGLDRTWMKLASLLEKNEIALNDVPDRFVREESTSLVEEWRELPPTEELVAAAKRPGFVKFTPQQFKRFRAIVARMHALDNMEQRLGDTDK
ncbi:MAG TPA: hypothetical protein VM243_06010 [Phycisphaerae bacterium]|nr:hypothetical protein [Phycisphaerae bacterium]